MNVQITYDSQQYSIDKMLLLFFSVRIIFMLLLGLIFLSVF
jgi:hypothetical protein